MAVIEKVIFRQQERYTATVVKGIAKLKWLFPDVELLPIETLDEIALSSFNNPSHITISLGKHDGYSNVHWGGMSYPSECVVISAMIRGRWGNSDDAMWIANDGPSIFRLSGWSDEDIDKSIRGFIANEDGGMNSVINRMSYAFTMTETIDALVRAIDAPESTKIWDMLYDANIAYESVSLQGALIARDTIFVSDGVMLSEEAVRGRTWQGVAMERGAKYMLCPNTQDTSMWTVLSVRNGNSSVAVPIGDVYTSQDGRMSVFSNKQAAIDACTTK